MQKSLDAATQSPSLTAEQIEFALRLESIFMPHARKQRNETCKRQTGTEHSREPIRFAHYTSAEAGLKIISSKRVWMRNATCMSDYSEVQYGFTFLQSFFSDKSKRNAFVTALDPCVPNVAMEAINLFSQWSDTRNPNCVQLNTYIASISEHQKEEDYHGRLSMWRAFGGNPARVAIVLSVPWYSGGAAALNIIFSPVAYLTENQAHEVVYKVIANIRSNYDFLRSIDRQIVARFIFDMLLAGVTCLKHEGFREELEWRVIYAPKIRSSPLIEISTETIAGVPQPVHKLPLDVRVSNALADLDLSRMLERIIIGPSPYP
jgi:hypothetical protein